MGYFRAILKNQEISPRALLLTGEVIELNPANYTAWHYRRKCLYELGEDLHKEMKFVEEKAMDTPKNYQIWYHRRALVEKINNASQECFFTGKVLEMDSKNYHAWAHRQWAVLKFNLFEKEIDYTQELLNIDVRNNSAWNHRWFVFTANDLLVSKRDVNALINREIEYCKTKALLAPRNECPFNYLEGLLWKLNPSLIVIQSLYGWLKETLLSVTPESVGARSLLVEVCIRMGLNNEARAECAELSLKYDSLRNSYWLERSYKVPR